MFQSSELYKKYARLSYIKKDSVALNYIKQLSDGEIIDDNIIKGFYDVYSGLQNKISIIKLMKCFIRQCLIMGKQTFLNKISLLKYIDPEKISVQLSEDELLALIDQDNSENKKNKKSNLYFVIGKNIICQLIDINIGDLTNLMEDITNSNNNEQEINKKLNDYLSKNYKFDTNDKNEKDANNIQNDTVKVDVHYGFNDTPSTSLGLNSLEPEEMHISDELKEMENNIFDNDNLKESIFYKNNFNVENSQTLNILTEQNKIIIDRNIEEINTDESIKEIDVNGTIKETDVNKNIEKTYNEKNTNKENVEEISIDENVKRVKNIDKNVIDNEVNKRIVKDKLERIEKNKYEVKTSDKGNVSENEHSDYTDDTSDNESIGSKINDLSASFNKNTNFSSFAVNNFSDFLPDNNLKSIEKESIESSSLLNNLLSSLKPNNKLMDDISDGINIDNINKNETENNSDEINTSSSLMELISQIDKNKIKTNKNNDSDIMTISKKKRFLYE